MKIFNQIAQKADPLDEFRRDGQIQLSVDDKVISEFVNNNLFKNIYQNDDMKLM